MSSHDAVTWQARIRGRVQGVGYRESCVRQARVLGLAGWVRNCRDGSVEVLLQGPPDRLERMREWLGRGPASARVDAVEVTPLAPPQPVWTEFERRPTP